MNSSQIGKRMKQLCREVQKVAAHSAGEMSRKQNYERFLKHFSEMEKREIAETLTYLLKDQDLQGLAWHVENARKLRRNKREP